MVVSLHKELEPVHGSGNEYYNELIPEDFYLKHCIKVSRCDKNLPWICNGDPALCPYIKLYTPIKDPKLYRKNLSRFRRGRGITMIKDAKYLSLQQIEFLGCESCEHFDADPITGMSICFPISQMKQFCQISLEGVLNEV
jgi:hypothetical protein